MKKTLSRVAAPPHGEEPAEVVCVNPAHAGEIISLSCLITPQYSLGGAKEVWAGLMILFKEKSLTKVEKY